MKKVILHKNKLGLNFLPSLKRWSERTTIEIAEAGQKLVMVMGLIVPF